MLNLLYDSPITLHYNGLNDRNLTNQQVSQGSDIQHKSIHQLFTWIADTLEFIQEDTNQEYL